MKKIKNRIIPFNLAKHSFGLIVAAAIAISVIGVNVANAVEDEDFVAKCSNIGRKYTALPGMFSLSHDIDLAKKCISHGLCVGEYYKRPGNFGEPLKGIVNCDKADKLLDDIKKAKKQQGAKKQQEADKAQAKICAKWDGQTYVESVMRKCDKPDTLCTVKKDGHLDCAKAKKLAGTSSNPSGSSKSGGSSSGGSTSSGGSSSSGANTKNPNLDSHSLTGGGIGSGPVGDFLGFPAWNRGVNFNPGSKVGPELLKIVLNITEILLRLAGIAAVIVVIYAGAMFIIGSYSASPDGIAKARTILINGVIGLIIAIISTAIITFIVGSLNG